MYYHLTQEQRIELSLLRRLGYSVRQVAKQLGVHASTVSRELHRNALPNGRYHAASARVRTRVRRTIANQARRKFHVYPLLSRLIATKLETLQWSPEQIAAWLKRSRHRVTVCAQTIYDWLYASRKDLLKHLRSQKGRYRRTRTNTLRQHQRAALLAARRIDQRPRVVEKRRFYGHWEGDTIVSGRSGNTSTARIGTLVERKSGYLCAFLLPSGESRCFAQGAAAALGRIPHRYLQTLTLDNGREMQSYELLERLTPLKVFFAYPYHSWERGTNENTNGLLRQYFPKGSNLGLVTQAQLDHAVKLLNTRPRKRLDYRTPAAVFMGRW